MGKKYIIIKLAPQVPSWCDKENNIYLSMPNKISKRLKEDCDMKMINKGVKAGLIIMEEHFEEEKVESVKEKIEKVKRRSRAKEEKKVEEVKEEPKNEVKIEVNIIKDEEEDKDGE